MCFKKTEVLKQVQCEVPIDFKALLNEFDDTEFVKTLSETFLDSSDEFSKDILSGLKSRDYVKVSAVAHALKGVSGNLMCSPLYRASSDLELYTKMENAPNLRSATKKANLVLEELERVLLEITREYGYT